MTENEGGLRVRFRSLRKASRDVFVWLRDDVTRMPGFALFSWRRHIINRKDFARSRKSGALEAAAACGPALPRDIQRTVWIYWAQGEASAPSIVRRCIQSWRDRNPGWEIVVLDSTRACGLVDMSDVPSFMPQRLFADTLRLRLLADRGGVWADATSYCHRALDEWAPLFAARGFFAFSEPGRDRSIDSWFIIAEKGGALIAAWRNSFDVYIRARRSTPVPYFIVMYAFDWVVRRDAALADLWRTTPRLPAAPAFLLIAALRGVIPIGEAAKAVASGLPVSKLTWKITFDDAAVERCLSQLQGQ